MLTGKSPYALQIGDTVLFQTKISNDRIGYVFADLSSSPFNFLTALPTKKGKETDPKLPNVMFAVFKVLVPNRFKACQTMKKLQKNEVIPEYELNNAKRAVDNEKLENQYEQERKLGTEVAYGNFVQFQHVASKRYMTICSEASKTESNNSLINLCDDNSEGTIFKILPRYKVRSEGDIVHYDDQIKLESLKSPGQFLHLSKHSLDKAGYILLSERLEVNLSSTQSALSLIPHYSRPLTEQSTDYLRAGNCVRLFHKEDECYIVAEGSFASSSPVLEDVHCRLRRMDLRYLPQPSTSSNTYWQIEKVNHPTSGDVISWGETCRFKHIPTRMYLAVDSQLQVKLKHRPENDEPDSDTLFSFHSLSQESRDEVLLGSYACIKHLLSGEWLHLETKDNYARKCVASPETKGLAGLQWDSAELYTLKTSKEKEDYDCFILQEVSEDLLDIFNYVAGIVPVLSSHIEMFSKAQVTEKEAYYVQKTLQELKSWLVTTNERERKNRQKLLRNLKVIEQLVEILQTGNNENLPKSQKEICRECYTIIKHYLEGDSRKNENYLGRFIELFQSHIRKELNAEEVLVEIVQDNINIVSRMAETSMDSMINQFCSTRDPRFLHFLSSLCVCDDRPIPSTQDKLLRSLVLSKGKGIFLQLSVRTIHSGNVVFFQKPGGTKQKLTSLRSSSENIEIQSIFELLEAQIYLFSSLCKGNNKSSINSLLHDPVTNPTGYIDFDQALHVARDDRVDITLRLRYAELILVMFVDVGENRSFLDHLCYSFSYDDIVATPYADTGGDEGETIALTGVENKNFPEIKVWILETFETHQSLRSDLEYASENKFLEQIIDVLGYLVRYGYYDDIDDVDDCMKHLIRLLDGTTDVPSEGKQGLLQLYQDTGRKEDCAENESVFGVKQKALKVTELFFKFKFYVKLQKYIYDFKVLREGLTCATEWQHPPQILAQLLANAHDNPDSLFMPSITRAVHGRFKFLFDGSENGCGFAPKDTSIPIIETVLIDLSTYDCDELVTSSLNLLTQIYFFQEELFAIADQVQLLITPESISDFNLVNETILPELRQLLRVDGNQKAQERIVQLVDKLSQICVTTNRMQPQLSKPNESNQVMLYNFGLVSEILEYAFSKAHGQATQSSHSSDSVRVCEEVFVSCFRFIKSLATGRESVQKKLFNHIDDLLDIQVPGDALADVAHLLTEVFTGRLELVLKVSEEHIEKIFHNIVCCRNFVIQAAFINSLRTMAKIEEIDLPIECNQAIIVKNFCRFRHTFCENIIAEKERMDNKRMKILMSKEETVLLNLLLSLTDMLATCAESTNTFIQSVCQNIFSSEELLKIMTNGNLQPLRKTPFAKCFIEVYLKQIGGQMANEISHGEEIWEYLGQSSSLLSKLARFLKAVPLDERTSITQCLCISGNGSINEVHQVSKRMTGITDMHGYIVSGLLELVVKGIIPFIDTFYCSCFNPNEASSSSGKEMEYKVSTMIVESLVQLRDELSSTASDGLMIYNEIINNLLEYERIMNDSGIDKSAITPREHFKASTASQILRNTPDVQQQNLNECFSQFSKQYCQVYCGRNSASFQIKSPVESLEYSEDGEELPLGPNFQHLVSLYVISSAQVASRLKPEVNQLIQQLEISQTCPSHLSENEQMVLDRRCLQLLRAIVVNQIKLIDPELKERDPIKFRQKFDRSVVPIQNEMQGFDNAISRIIKLLSHPNETISREVLALTKALLYSGNTNVQEGLSGAFLETKDGTFFVTLKQRLEMSSLNFKQIKELQLHLVSKKEVESSLIEDDQVHSETAKRLTRVKSSSKQQIEISLEELERNEEDNNTVETSFSFDKKMGCSGTVEDDHDSTSTYSQLQNILGNDSRWTTLVLEVVGLMCDGQHRTLQNYLRDQPDNLQIVNVVAEIANFLHTFTDSIAMENLSQIHKVLQCLIEMCVGNIDNQLVILDKLVIEPLNRILQLPAPQTDEADKDQYLVELVEVKGSTVELISVLLEEIDIKTAQVAESIGLTLDHDAVIATIDFFRTMRSTSIICENEMDDDCERGMYRAYHMLVALIDYEQSPFSSTKDIKKNAHCNKMKEGIHECESHTKTIEIQYKQEENSSNTVLTRVNFPYNSQEKLREDLTEKVRWNINRDSMEDKQRALLDLLPALKRDINHQTRLKQTKIMRPVLAYHTLRVYLLMLTTVILNLFVLFTYSVLDDVDEKYFLIYPDTPIWFHSYGVYLLGAVHLLLSFWIVVEYFLINWPHFQIPHFLYKLWYRVLQIVLREKNFRQLPRFSFINVNIFGVSTLYMLVFLACSILSMAFRGYFYCVCLLFIIFTSDILQRVLRAVTKHGKALIWVAVLGIIVLFIYAVISFAWLHGYFSPEDDQFCDNLGQCFYSVLRIGLLDTLGSSIPLNSTGVTTGFTPNLSVRLIYDLSFFIIVTTIGMNIVFGIIVDSFGELREERSNIEAEQKNKCFICDLPSYDFERRAKGFRNHIKLDHNMWDYVYYSVYIDRIDTGDQNAIQKYVYEKITDNDTGFFPQEEARCLAGNDNVTSQKLDELQEKMEGLLQQFKNKEYQKNLRAKKNTQLRFEADLKTGQSSQFQF